MAKKKEKSGFSSLPFPIQLALKAAVKKNAKTEEEREKVMEALEGLDLNTLLYDPEALRAVMSNPAGELGNYVVNNEENGEADNESADEAPDAAIEEATPVEADAEDSKVH